MSSTFRATANSNTTIGYVWYGSNEWAVGSSEGACQGAYMATKPSQSRVGLMLFNGAGAALRGKVIQSITLKITCSGAGSGSSGKVLSFHRANVQAFDKSLRGSAQVGAALGTLTGKFYSNTTTHTLSVLRRPARLSDRGQFRACAVQRGNIQGRRLFRQLRPRYLLHPDRQLHRRHGLCAGERRVEAVRRVGARERRMEAVRAVLPQGRRMGARIGRSPRRAAFSISYRRGGSEGE